MLKREKDAGSQDNTIQLPNEQDVTLGPVAPLFATGIKAAPVEKATEKPAEADALAQAKAPLVIDWSQYQTTTEQSQAAPEAPPAPAEPEAVAIAPTEVPADQNPSPIAFQPQVPDLVAESAGAETAVPHEESVAPIEAATFWQGMSQELAETIASVEPSAPIQVPTAQAPTLEAPEPITGSVAEPTVDQPVSASPEVPTADFETPAATPSIMGWDDVELTYADQASRTQPDQSPIAGAPAPELQTVGSITELVGTQKAESMDEADAWVRLDPVVLAMAEDCPPPLPIQGADGQPTEPISFTFASASEANAKPSPASPAQPQEVDYSAYDEVPEPVALDSHQPVQNSGSFWDSVLSSTSIDVPPQSSQSEATQTPTPDEPALTTSGLEWAGAPVAEATQTEQSETEVAEVVFSSPTETHAIEPDFSAGTSDAGPVWGQGASEEPVSHTYEALETEQSSPIEYAADEPHLSPVEASWPEISVPRDEATVLATDSAETSDQTVPAPTYEPQDFDTPEWSSRDTVAADDHEPLAAAPPVVFEDLQAIDVLDAQPTDETAPEPDVTEWPSQTMSASADDETDADQAPVVFEAPPFLAVDEAQESAEAALEPAAPEWPGQETAAVADDPSFVAAPPVFESQPVFDATEPQVGPWVEESHAPQDEEPVWEPVSFTPTIDAIPTAPEESPENPLAASSNGSVSQEEDSGWTVTSVAPEPPPVFVEPPVQNEVPTEPGTVEAQDSGAAPAFSWPAIDPEPSAAPTLAELAPGPSSPDAEALEAPQFQESAEEVRPDAAPQSQEVAESTDEGISMRPLASPAELLRAISQAPAEAPRGELVPTRYRLSESEDFVDQEAKDKRLGELLVDHRLITSAQLTRALDRQGETKERLGQILVAMQAITERRLLQVLAAQKGVSPWHLEDDNPSQEALAHVPKETCRMFQGIPVAVRGNMLLVAMRDPRDQEAIDAFARESNLKIEPLLADEARLAYNIDKAYSIAEARLLAQSDRVVAEALQAVEELRTQSASTWQTDGGAAKARPVVGLVNQLIEDGIRMRASDLHIEPHMDTIHIRYRLDGRLVTTRDLPVELADMITARIKTMANLDLGDRANPAEGRISAQFGAAMVDVRVSVMPNMHGARIALRILDKAVGLKKIESVGFSERNEEAFRSIIHRPHGLILVTGPTGAGKTTTLYSAIGSLRDDATNIMTVEDPVEYEIDGVNQFQVNERVGQTFGAQLKAILRQDPDVILVGEIRDKDTAETAIRAALTGHLVLSTLHCNDAVGVVARMAEMEVDPYLLSSALVATMGQRLVRVLCPDCKEKRAPTPQEAWILKTHFGYEGVQEVCAPTGCEKCFGTGYRGRTAVHEIVPVTDEVRHLIAERARAEAIHEAAKSYGFITMSQDAGARVVSGETSLDEIRRVLGVSAAGRPAA